jgi:hypothetical protein
MRPSRVTVLVSGGTCIATGLAAASTSDTPLETDWLKPRLENVIMLHKTTTKIARRSLDEDITSRNSSLLMDLLALVSSRPYSALRLERESSDLHTGGQRISGRQ